MGGSRSLGQPQWQKPRRPPFEAWPHAPSLRAIYLPRGFPATQQQGCLRGWGRANPGPGESGAISWSFRALRTSPEARTRHPRRTWTQTPSSPVEPPYGGHEGNSGASLYLELSGPLEGLWGSQPGAELLLPVGVVAGYGCPSGERQQRAEASGQAGASGRSEYQQWRQREEAQHDERRGAAVREQRAARGVGRRVNLGEGGLLGGE